MKMKIGVFLVVGVLMLGAVSLVGAQSWYDDAGSDTIETEQTPVFNSSESFTRDVSFDMESRVDTQKGDDEYDKYKVDDKIDVDADLKSVTTQHENDTLNEDIHLEDGESDITAYDEPINLSGSVGINSIDNDTYENFTLSNGFDDKTNTSNNVTVTDDNITATGPDAQWVSPVWYNVTMDGRELVRIMKGYIAEGTNYSVYYREDYSTAWASLGDMFHEVQRFQLKVELDTGMTDVTSQFDETTHVSGDSTDTETFDKPSNVTGYVNVSSVDSGVYDNFALTDGFLENTSASNNVTINADNITVTGPDAYWISDAYFNLTVDGHELRRLVDSWVATGSNFSVYLRVDTSNAWTNLSSWTGEIPRFQLKIEFYGVGVADEKQLLSEGFESSVPPSGWYEYVWPDNEYDFSWQVGTSDSYNGSQTAFITADYDDTDGGEEYSHRGLRSPSMDFSGISTSTDIWVSFYQWTTDSSEWNTYSDCKLRLSTNDSDYSTIISDLSGTDAPPEYSWAKFTYDLSPWAGEPNVRLSWDFAFPYGDIGGTEWEIDDVRVAYNATPKDYSSIDETTHVSGDSTDTETFDKPTDVTGYVNVSSVDSDVYDNFTLTDGFLENTSSSNNVTINDTNLTANGYNPYWISDAYFNLTVNGHELRRLVDSWDATGSNYTVYLRTDTGNSWTKLSSWTGEIPRFQLKIELTYQVVDDYSYIDETTHVSGDSTDTETYDTPNDVTGYVNVSSVDSDVYDNFSMTDGFLANTSSSNNVSINPTNLTATGPNPYWVSNAYFNLTVDSYELRRLVDSWDATGSNYTVFLRTDTADVWTEISTWSGVIPRFQLRIELNYQNFVSDSSVNETVHISGDSTDTETYNTPNTVEGYVNVSSVDSGVYDNFTLADGFLANTSSSNNVTINADNITATGPDAQWVSDAYFNLTVNGHELRRLMDSWITEGNNYTVYLRADTADSWTKLSSWSGVIPRFQLKIEISCNNYTFETTFLDEDFESSVPPSGWYDYEWADSGYDETWYSTDVDTHLGTYCANIGESDGSEYSHHGLRSESLNFSGFSSSDDLWVSFYHSCGDTSLWDTYSDSKLRLSTNDSDYSTVLSNLTGADAPAPYKSWNRVECDLSPWAGEPNVRLSWDFAMPSDGTWYAVDTVNVTYNHTNYGIRSDNLFMNESFKSVPPSGWYQHEYSDNQNTADDWERQDAYPVVGDYYTSIFHDTMSYTHISLRTESMNFSSFSSSDNLMVSFYHQCGDPSSWDGDCKLRISTNDSDYSSVVANFASAPNEYGGFLNWTYEEYDLSAWAGESNVRLGWDFAMPSDGTSWYVDGVNITYDGYEGKFKKVNVSWKDTVDFSVNGDLKTAKTDGFSYTLDKTNVSSIDVYNYYGGADFHKDWDVGVTETVKDRFKELNIGWKDTVDFSVNGDLRTAKADGFSYAVDKTNVSSIAIYNYYGGAEFRKDWEVRQDKAIKDKFKELDIAWKDTVDFTVNGDLKTAKADGFSSSISMTDVSSIEIYNYYGGAEFRKDWQIVQDTVIHDKFKELNIAWKDTVDFTVNGDLKTAKADGFSYTVDKTDVSSIAIYNYYGGAEFRKDWAVTAPEAYYGVFKSLKVHWYDSVDFEIGGTLYTIQSSGGTYSFSEHDTESFGLHIYQGGINVTKDFTAVYPVKTGSDAPPIPITFDVKNGSGGVVASKTVDTEYGTPINTTIGVDYTNVSSINVSVHTSGYREDSLEVDFSGDTMTFSTTVHYKKETVSSGFFNFVSDATFWALLIALLTSVGVGAMTRNADVSAFTFVGMIVLTWALGFVHQFVLYITLFSFGLLFVIKTRSKKW